MRKILIIYGPTSQKGLVASIIKYTKNNKYEIVGFNTSDWTFNDDVNKIPFFYRLIKNVLRIPKVNIVVRRLFNNHLLRSISETYDAIDIAYFTKSYFGFLDYWIRLGKPFKITIWGSDFYRSSSKELQRKKYYLDRAKIVQVATEQISTDFLNVYPCLQNKIRICNYGIEMFNEIDKLRNTERTVLLDEAEKYIVVTCGYNASKAQQHEKIISVLKHLPHDIKNKIYLFFPMTYGTPSKSYLTDIKTHLNEICIPYHIFDSRLNDEELAMLRLQSDIVVNIQTSDALSASLQEHLYAGGILIAGEWLPYDIFKNNNIFFYREDENTLYSRLVSCVENITEIKTRAKDNLQNIKKLSSWDYKAKELSDIFYLLIS